MTTPSASPDLVDFRNAVRILLEAKSAGCTEHELIRSLTAPPYCFFEPDCFNLPYRLFQIHFLLFHTLYQIRDQLESDGARTLEITPLRICISPCTRGPGGIANADPMETYYRDWTNLVRTQPEHVDGMLDNFWRKMAGAGRMDAPEIAEALATLELVPTSTYDEVKQQYRRLAMKYHPDRGGDAKRLQDINAAKLMLDRFFQH